MSRTEHSIFFFSKDIILLGLFRTLFTSNGSMGQIQFSESYAVCSTCKTCILTGYKNIRFGDVFFRIRIWIMSSVNGKSAFPFQRAPFAQHQLH